MSGREYCIRVKIVSQFLVLSSSTIGFCMIGMQDLRFNLLLLVAGGDELDVRHHVARLQAGCFGVAAARQPWRPSRKRR